ncbi:3,4-dihydroxy-2-butanone-4-phosphate synthase [Halolamina sp.]|jgi:3,4-dihydroxy 2-butanone 4-phosphate synthase|uniref:3,4-dihydroxy-2-butanone-4-phosphate synthase n=1 Tax=Halolamina sp. TaxID=1940283 RepID=UPI000223C0F2|nr:3,4-dihydroxy-2-butanone 4-phosphate synthase [halophilic archaeon DL31]
MSSGRNAIDAVEAAIAAFGRDEPVLVHDAADREGEVDIIYPATAADADAMTRLRNDAGGLICVAVTDAVAEAWDLPFLSDALGHPATESDHLAYDARSSFSLPVNHRETFTGITDDDRSLTAVELGRAAAATLAGAFDAEAFAETFRSPGHINLLRGAPSGLADRQGHTELGLALADAAGQPPAVVVCEMLDDETGGALTPSSARAYAERNGLTYVEGRDLLTRLD